MDPHDYIKKPCHENWNTMTGNERKKFCDQCACSVHNLTGMKHEQIMGLKEKLGGNLCGVFHQPSQHKKVRRIHLRKSMVLGASISSLALAACQSEKVEVQTHEQISPTNQPANPDAPKETKTPEIIMGKIYIEPEDTIINKPKSPVLMGIVCLPEKPRK